MPPEDRSPHVPPQPASPKPAPVQPAPPPSGEGRRASARRSYRRVYARYADALAPRSRGAVRLLPLAAAALGALGLALVLLASRRVGAALGPPLMLGLGAGALLGALALALRARRATEDPRLHLVRGRVVSVEPPRAEHTPSSTLVEVHRRLRVRSDGMVRHDPPRESRVRLQVGPALAEELRRHVDAASEVELAATTEGVALALHEESGADC
jgi:hypothetical protein